MRNIINNLIKPNSLVILIAIIITVISTILLLELKRSANNAITKEFSLRQLDLVRHIEKEINSFFKTRMEVIRLVSNRVEGSILDKSVLKQNIDEYFSYEKTQFLESVSIYDNIGSVVYSTDKKLIEREIYQSEFFTWAKNPNNINKAYISTRIKCKCYSDSLKTIPHFYITITIPIYKLSQNSKQKKKFQGLISETIDFDKYISMKLNTLKGTNDEKHLGILNAKGELLFYTNYLGMANTSYKNKKSCLNCHLNFNHISSMMKNVDGYLTIPLRDNESELISYTTSKINNLSWIITLSISNKNIISFMSKNYFQSFMLLTMITITFLSISFLIFRNYKAKKRFDLEYQLLLEKNILKEKYEASERRYKKLVDSSPDAIIILIENKIYYINDSGAYLLGVNSYQDLLGELLINHITSDYHQSFNKNLEQLSSDNSISPLFEAKIATANNIFIDVELILVLTTYNSLVAVQVLVRDISERKKTENELILYREHLESLVAARTEELKKAYEKLRLEIDKKNQYALLLQQNLDSEKELSFMKSRFISTTSHEFRTPLAAILSSTELLQRYNYKWDSVKQNQHFDLIKRKIDYLTELLNDILFVSKADNVSLKLKPELLDFKNLSFECFEDSKAQGLGSHKFEYSYNCSHTDFFLDPILIKYILNNLLSNAVKFSPNGGIISLDIYCHNYNLIIKVSDCGIGIPKDEIPKILNTFYRASNIGVISGTGLGLSIINHAVNLHQGEISIDSELGKGTTFIVKIPIDQSMKE